jgi:3-phosphoglycerate kinase
LVYGEFALHFLRALGVKLGESTAPQNESDLRYQPFFIPVLEKAKEKGVKIHFPTDFHVAYKAEVEVPEVEHVEGEA